MVEEAASNPPEPASVETSKTKRERSLVEFPYADIQSAAELAAGIMHKGGGTCDESQLSVWLNQAVMGGTFRSRLSASKMFGFVAGANKALTLTDLGRRVADPQSIFDAKAEAFLGIPLYATLYEKLHGYALPPAAAIERQMIALGVIATQSDRARQAFMKSANQAGYIDGQTGRFVKPGNVNYGSDGSVDSSPPPPKGGGGGGNDSLHPFILGLLKTLPQPETEWDVTARAKWLQTAASIFGLIYQGDGTIKVEVISEKVTS